MPNAFSPTAVASNSMGGAATACVRSSSEGERKLVMRPAILVCAIAISCLPNFASRALAQSTDLVTQARDPAGVVAPNPPPVPPKNASHAIRRDPATGRAIIIVSGRGRKASQRIKRPRPGGPAMLNPQPLPPKALPAH